MQGEKEIGFKSSICFMELKICRVMPDCVAGVGLLPGRAGSDHAGPQSGRLQPGLGQDRPLAPLGWPGQLSQGRQPSVSSRGERGGAEFGKFWGNFHHIFRVRDKLEIMDFGGL